jgi:hypothetical protein
MRCSAISTFVACLLVALFLRANPKPPLTVAVSPTSQTVKSGADVRLKATITNTSSHELIFFDRNPICDYPIKIHDANRNQPAETVAKQQSHCDSKPWLDGGRRILVRLNPRESVDEEIKVSFYYDVRRTGTYTAQVSRHLPDEIIKEDISSNRVTFVVSKSRLESEANFRKSANRRRRYQDLSYRERRLTRVGAQATALAGRLCREELNEPRRKELACCLGIDYLLR